MESIKGISLNRILYQTRRIFEQSNFDDTYVCSFSSRTIVYKGMFLVGQLRSFFKDLQDDEYKSAIALVHSRFSTNTMPSWQRLILIVLLFIMGKLTQLKAMLIICYVAKNHDN